MKIAEITIEQYRKLKGNWVNQDVRFEPTTMPSGRFFISEFEVENCHDAEFAWVKDLPLIDFDNTVPDTTPPTEMGVGVTIPDDYPVTKLFPNLKFELNGYVIPIVSYGNGYAVDLAYLMWDGFRKEQDYGYNQIVFNTFKTLWYELKAKVDNQDFVQL